MNHSIHRLLLGMSLLSTLLIPRPAHGQSLVLFTTDQPHSFPRAACMSADGQWIAGSIFDFDTRSGSVGLWDAFGNLQHLTRYSEYDSAFGCSDDSSVIGGSSNGYATIWRRFEDEDRFLGPGCVFAITPAGTYAAGYINNDDGYPVAFRHDVIADHIETFPPLPGHTESYAAALTPTGDIVAGSSADYSTSTYVSTAVLWRVGHTQVLPSVPGNPFCSATDLSADGSVVIGQASCCSDGPFHAIRWKDGQPSLLIPDAEFSNASAISADGNTVIGDDNNGVYIWDPVHHRRSIASVLALYGVDMTGVLFSSAVDISADGTVMAGLGFQVFPDGTYRSIVWKVTLPPYCPADFDGSGFVDLDDYTAFVHAFEDGTDDRADIDQSGFIDLDDFSSYIHLFEQGC